MSPIWSFHRASELASHRDIWDGLCHATGGLPFLQTDFLQPLLEQFGTGQERIAIAHDEGRPVAATLLAPGGTGRWQTFQPSQLPLGPWLQGPGQRLEALAPTLLRRLPGLGLSLGLTQLDPRHVARPSDTAQLETLDYIQTAWVDIDQEFDRYWESRGKNLRTNVRKQRSKLESEGRRLSLDVLTDPAAVAAAIADYGRLESSGWKAGTGTAVAPDNAQGRFYIAMMERFCRAGRGEIWRYRFDDEVVAMDLCIAAEDTLVVLKTAFDAAHKTVSPATLMHHEAFRHVFEGGRFRRIEFYGRVMEWHTRWTDQQRTLYHATGLRWAIMAPLRQALRNLRRPPAAEPAAEVQ